MIDTISRWMGGITPEKTAYSLLNILAPIGDRLSSQSLSSAALAITGAGSTTAKIGAAIYYASVMGSVQSIAANTNLPALTGITAPANNYVIACFFIDGGGTTTVVGGTPGATAATAKFPPFPAGKTLIGWLLITNGASVFTGGTTPLDTATTLYFNSVGPFDPSILV